VGGDVEDSAEEEEMIAKMCGVAGVVFAACVSIAGVNYNEATGGDISDDGFNPLALVLGPGSNVVRGKFGPSGVEEVPDLDYVSVTVAEGWRLSRMNVVEADVGGAVSFIAVQGGAVFTEPYTTRDPSSLLGWSHFGTTSVGLDLLPEMGLGGGAIGFAPPLGAGVYTFWIMELDMAFEHSYGFDFVVTRCLANVNGDEAVDFGDFLAFFNCYDTEQSCADVDGNPGVDFGDFLAFFNGYDAGC
jgi:hypothetical protein